LAQIACFAQAVGAAGLCSGQSLDMTHTADNCDLATVYQIHHLKTGVLLGAACRLPGIAADRNESELQQLQDFGEALGLLLQINDDLMDGQHNTGKSCGKDQAQNKASIATVEQNNGQTKLQEALDTCKEKLAQLSYLENQTDLEHIFLSDHAQLVSSMRNHPSK
jgi:farnesyl diphosphate synthase